MPALDSLPLSPVLTPNPQPPTPNFPPHIYTVGGAVQASNGVYIPRQADSDLLACCRAGAFAYVLAPRQLGKSSLMIHTAEALAEGGCRTVTLDLTAIGTGVTADEWYFGLAYEIADQLELQSDLQGWWRAEAGLGLAQRFTRFFKEIVLAEIGAPVVIFVDEIDTTLSLPFTDDFFAAIRSCHDARARTPAYRRLSFVLIGVATPGDLIHDPRRTPFNIGQRVEMTDFTPAEAAPLAAGLGLPPAEAAQVLGWVLGWTGGHPYLTQRLCQAITGAGRALWSERDVAALVQRLFLGVESGGDNNIQFVRDMLTKRAPDGVGVLTTYRAIRAGQTVPDEEQSLVKAHLKLAGVVRREGRTLRVRNRIYRAVFDDRWARAHLPATLAWLPWLRRGLVAGVTVFVLVVAGLGVYAQARREEAEAARTLAQARELALRAQTAADPEAGLLLASEAVRRMVEGHIDDTDGQIRQVLSAALANSPVRLRLQHQAAVHAATFSPDGTRLATASADGLGRVWDARTGTLLGTLAGHSGAALAIAWAPDGKGIATAGADGSARVWDAATFQQIRIFSGHTGEVLSVAWAPDGRTLLTASRDTTARVWDAATGATLHILSGHSGWVRSAAYRPDGQQIVTASADTTARVWDSATGAPVRTLSGHIRDVRAAAWSPDGLLLATASEDGSVRLWDPATGSESRILSGHSGEVTGLAWSPDSLQLVTTGSDSSVRLWDVASGQERGSLRGHNDAVLGAAWNPDGATIVTASADGTARVWHPAPAPDELRRLVPGAGAVRGLALSPDGTRLFTTHADGATRLWAAGGTVPLLVMTHSSAGGGSIGPLADGRIATVGAEGVQLWTRESGQALATWPGAGAEVRAIAAHPRTPTLAVALADGTIALWDSHSATVLATLRGPSAAVQAVAWSPDGTSLASVSLDGTARLWNAATGQERITMHGPSEGLTDVAWTPDGTRLLTSSSDGTARVWDAATGNELLALRGPGDPLWAITVSPDGGQLATAGGDVGGTVRVWDATTGREQLALPGPTGGATALAWSSDGRSLVVGGMDGTVRQYAMRLDTLLALAATRTTRTLTAAEWQPLGLPPTATVAPPPPPVTPSATPSAPTPSAPTPNPSPPAPDGQIAFASNRGNPQQSHIYIMNADGTGAHALTSAPLYNLYPSWSPDGTRLVYIGADPDEPDDSPAGDIFIIHADGTGRVQLTHGLHAKWPEWSPDGRWIAYADAPENRAAAYDIYLRAVDSNDLRRLTDTPGFDGMPAWTPDGAIIFASARGEDKTKNTHLYRMSADGAAPPTPLLRAPGWQDSPAVAADGRIAFVSTQDGNERIYTMAADGSGVQPLTGGPGVDRYPAWSPDGAWLAFHSNRDSRANFEIYLVPSTGGPARRLTSDAAFDDEPAWHR